MKVVDRATSPVLGKSYVVYATKCVEAATDEGAKATKDVKGDDRAAVA
jgi:hypothetical protein